MPGEGGRGGGRGGGPPRWGPNGPGGGWDFEPLDPFAQPANTDPTPIGEAPVSELPPGKNSPGDYFYRYSGNEIPYRPYDIGDQWAEQQLGPQDYYTKVAGNQRGANEPPFETGNVLDFPETGKGGQPEQLLPGDMAETELSGKMNSLSDLMDFFNNGEGGENSGVPGSGMGGALMGGALYVLTHPEEAQANSDYKQEEVQQAAQDAYDWATGGNSGNDNPGGEYMPGNDGGGWDQPQEWWSEPSYGGAPAQPDYQPDWSQPQQDWSPQYEGTGNSGDYSDPYQDWSPEYEGTGGSGGWDNGGGGGDDWGGAPMDSGNGGISGGSGQFGAGDFGGSSVNFNDLLSLMDFYGGGGGCFAAGTPIRMADGSEKPIEKIEVGDKVLAYDEKARELQPAEVAKLHVHEDCEIWDLKVEGCEPVATTKEHRFYVDGQWKALRDWVHCSQFLTYDADSKRMISRNLGVISVDIPPRKATVYNLTLKTVHTFFAGGLLAHNTKDTFGGEDTSWRFGGD